MEGEAYCNEKEEENLRREGKEEEKETEKEEKKKCKDDEEEKEESEEEESSPRGVLEIQITGSDSDRSNSDRRSSFGSTTSLSSAAEEEVKTSLPVVEVVEEGGVAGWFSKEEGGVAGWFSKETTGNLLQWKTMVERIKKRSGKRLSIIPLLVAGNEFSKRSFSSRKKLGRNRSAEETLDCGDFMVPKPSWRNFTYKELAQATHNFSPERLVGKGGHAEVYKGCLPDGEVVAVKKIIKQDKNDDDRVGDFLAELGIIAHISHPNAAKLIGFTVDGGLHLVLQFLPHGSLASVLHGSVESVDWKKRYKVAMGLAEGLHYLHSDCQRRIIHRDITASNILLTEDYEPQISDFGLAKWLPEKWLHHVVSPIEGTFGYMAPEYFMHGIVNEKTDVFAFGVLLLELLTGRRAVDSSRQSLVMWAKPLLEKNEVKELVDPRLDNQYDMVQFKRVMFTASTCLHHLPNMRPSMKRVVHLLRGENEELDVKQKSMGGRALVVDACDLEDYTSTTYLKDLNRHMELVME